jgi:hypothetical protein
MIKNQKNILTKKKKEPGSSTEAPVLIVSAGLTVRVYVSR